MRQAGLNPGSEAGGRADGPIGHLSPRDSRRGQTGAGWLLSPRLCSFVAFLVLITGGVVAPAEEIESSGSGRWLEVSTWDLGRVPGAGDEVVIQSGHTVWVDETVPCAAHSIGVEEGATLHIEALASLIREAAGADDGWLEVEGELIVAGELASTDAAAASDEDVLLSVEPTGWLVLQGDPLEERSVLEVVPGSESALILNLGSVDSGATHLQVLSGWAPYTVVSIEEHYGQGWVKVARGLLAAPRTVLEAAADSVVIDARGSSLFDLTGSILVDETGAGRRVDAALSRPLDDTMVCFLEWPNEADAIAAGESIFFSEAIVAGTRVRAFRAARIAGATSAPASVEDGSGIDIFGRVDADWFEIAHTSRFGKAITVRTGLSPIDFDDGWFHDYHSKYQVALVASPQSTDVPSTVQWSRLYVDTAHGEDDGDYGHVFLFDDQDEFDHFTLSSVTARRTLDDFVFTRGGASLTLEGCHVFHSLSGNFVDVKSTVGSMAIEVRECRVFGYGENAIQADEGDADWSLRDNLFSRSGAALNQNGVDDHNLQASAAYGILAFDGSGFHSLRDTIQWSAAAGVFVAPVGGAGVVFEDAVIRYNGVRQSVAGVIPLDPWDHPIGGVISNSESFGRYRFEDCEFVDNPRRGIDTSQHRFHGRGIAARAGSWTLRGCSFRLGPMAAPSYPPSADAHVTLVGALQELAVEDCRFEGGAWSIDMTASQGESVPRVNGSSFVDQSAGAIRAVSPVEVTFNSFAMRSGAVATRLESPGSRVVANVCVADSVGSTWLDFATAADTVMVRSEWNVLSMPGSDGLRVGGQSLAVGEWVDAHDLFSSLSTGGGADWSLVVADLNSLTLIESSVAVDFVLDPSFALDLDDTLPDAGAHPLWENSSTPAPLSRGELRLRVYPNPSRSETFVRLLGSAPPSFRLEVFDLRGRRVRTLLQKESQEGLMRWDGRDGEGRRVVSGVYFLRLVGGAVDAGKAARVVLLR